MTDAQRERLGHQRIEWKRRVYLGLFGPIMGALIFAFGVLCGETLNDDLGLLVAATLWITGLVVAGSNLWSLITGREKAS
jgi:hypothetical protein